MDNCCHQESEINKIHKNDPPDTLIEAILVISKLPLTDEEKADMIRMLMKK